MSSRGCRRPASSATPRERRVSPRDEGPSSGGRAIGPVGALARAVAGLPLLVLPFVSDGVTWRDALLGLVVFPAVLLLAQLVRLRFAQTALRATGPAGFAFNAIILALLLFFSATRPATLLWLGASLLLAAWRGYAGCESLAVSNWLLRRDDQVGCLLFAPLDGLEARLARRKVADSAR